MSFLSAIAKVPVAVFKWLASPKGQNVVLTGEALLVTAFPQLTGLVNITNSWLQKIITTETIAAAAGAQTGTGVEKAAAVIAAMQPELAKYFPTMTADKIALANTKLVEFLNALEGPAPVAPPLTSGAAVVKTA